MGATWLCRGARAWQRGGILMHKQIFRRRTLVRVASFLLAAFVVVGGLALQARARAEAYRLYLEQSSVKRPLLIADLTESRIDSLLQQEGIGNALKQHLYYPGYIRNADLATLYNAAFAFLYPSLRESFGIPLVEAMACGTPVITGNTSSMPEVGGPGILAIDPCRPEEIARAVLRLENEDTLYRRQREYGLLRARQFSWEKTADELIQVYRSLFK